MTLNLRPCWFPVLSLCLGACVHIPPAPVVTAVPAEPFEWMRGRALVRHSHRGIEFAAAFEADRGEHLEWLVRIENHSNEAVDVSPAHFHYRVADAGPRGKWVRAIDPTAAIAQLDLARAHAKAGNAQADRNQFANDAADVFIRGLLGVEQSSAAEDRVARGQRRSSHRSALVAMGAQRDILANQTVRRTRLRPGEGVGGRVLFPRIAHRGKTELILWVQGAIARFPYAQGQLGSEAQE